MLQRPYLPFHLLHRNVTTRNVDHRRFYRYVLLEPLILLVPIPLPLFSSYDNAAKLVFALSFQQTKIDLSNSNLTSRMRYDLFTRRALGLHYLMYPVGMV